MHADICTYVRKKETKQNRPDTSQSRVSVFWRTPRYWTDFGRDYTRMTVCTIPTACFMFSQHIVIPNSCLPCLRSHSPLALLQEPRHFSQDEGGKGFESLFISLDKRRRAFDRQFVQYKYIWHVCIKNVHKYTMTWSKYYDDKEVQVKLLAYEALSY